MIKGTIDCRACKEIPSGSVVYVYVFDADNKQVIGHQTLQSIDNFPFEYRVDLDQNDVKNCALRVQVERGESVLFVKDGVRVDLDGSKEGQCNIELEQYVNRRASLI